MSFVSLYAPNKDPERNTFFSSLTLLVYLFRPTFVCGDFNSVLDNALDRKRRSSYVGSQSALAQESGPALQSLLSFTQTYPLWRTPHPTQVAYSWTHGSGSFASLVDMVWAPISMEQCIQECDYHPSFFFDHQYLLVKFHLDEEIISGPGMWKFNTSLLDDQDFCALIDSFWLFWRESYDPADYDSVLDWWDQGMSYLHELTFYLRELSLYWQQTWAQLHLCPFPVLRYIDLNWQVAHRVLHTGSRLHFRFGMQQVYPLCFCGADNEDLEHLFFECE